MLFRVLFLLNPKLGDFFAGIGYGRSHLGQKTLWCTDLHTHTHTHTHRNQLSAAQICGVNCLVPGWGQWWGCGLELMSGALFLDLNLNRSKFRPPEMPIFGSRFRPAKNHCFWFLIFLRFFGQSQSRPQKSDRVFWGLDLDPKKSLSFGF